jgi:hypothetical protein
MHLNLSQGIQINLFRSKKWRNCFWRMESNPKELKKLLMYFLVILITRVCLILRLFYRIWAENEDIYKLKKMILYMFLISDKNQPWYHFQPPFQVCQIFIFIIYFYGIFIGSCYKITKSPNFYTFNDPTISSIWHCQAALIVIALIASYGVTHYF